MVGDRHAVARLALLAIATACVLAGCSASIGRPSAGAAPDVNAAPTCAQASAWPEADRLFRRDRHWVGADGASTVALGGERTLWLFGDTWVDPSGRGTRQGARLVSNSVAIQTGNDPTTASIAFYWGHAGDGTPTAFVPDRGPERLWFGNGVRVGDRLVLFLNRIVHTDTGLGFASVGWAAVMVDNPDAEPSAWRMTPLEAPPNPLGVIVGFAAVLRDDTHVYALGAQDPAPSHPVFAARWPVADVQRGHLRDPQWWTGPRAGWLPDASPGARRPLFDNGASELSVHFDTQARRFVAVQAQGFGAADIAVRSAPELTGPWSEPRLVYRPPERERPRVLIYAAKAHPEFGGADLALTYATNSTEFAEHLTDPDLYYPRFVRLPRCRALPAAHDVGKP